MAVRPSRRIVIAVIGSVVVHALVAAWLTRARPVENRSPRPQAQRITIAIVRVPVSPAVATPPARRATTKHASNPVATTPHATGTTAAAPPPESSSSSSSGSTDAPRSVSLVPRGSAPGTELAASGSSGGVTIRNDGAAGVDEAAERAVAADRVRRRVQSFAEADVGRARATSGLVQPYVEALRRGLQQSVADAPRFSTPGAAAQVAAEYAARLQRFGRTGALDDDAPRRDVIPPSPSDLITPGSRDEAIAKAVATYRMMRDATEKRARQALLVLLEIRQARDGRLLSTELLERSGNPRFDAYVMERVPGVVERVGGQPDPALTRDELRTRWSVTGGVGDSPNGFAIRVQLVEVY